MCWIEDRAEWMKTEIASEKIWGNRNRSKYIWFKIIDHKDELLQPQAKPAAHRIPSI